MVPEQVSIISQSWFLAWWAFQKEVSNWLKTQTALLHCRTVASELKERLEDKESGAQFLVGLKQMVTDFKTQAKADMEKCEQKQDYGDDDSTTAGALSNKRLRSILLGSGGEKKKKKKGKASESDSADQSDDGSDDDDDEDSSNTWRLDDAGEMQLKRIQKERAKAKKKDRADGKTDCFCFASEINRGK